MKSEKAKMYDAFLCIKGMDETIKFDWRISRKMALFLSHVIDQGLTKIGTESSELLQAMPKGSTEELIKLSGECLEKAGLADFHQKMKAF